MKHSLASALLFAFVALAAGQAGSHPTLPQLPTVDNTQVVVPVHQGCHFDCRFSPRLGWHNHSNSECRPEPCREQFGVPPRGPVRERYDHAPDNPCHFDCRYSPEHGWHNHSNAQCRPEPCRRRY